MREEFPKNEGSEKGSEVLEEQEGENLSFEELKENLKEELERASTTEDKRKLISEYQQEVISTSERRRGRLKEVVESSGASKVGQEREEKISKGFKIHSISFNQIFEEMPKSEEGDRIRGLFEARYLPSVLIALYNASKNPESNLHEVLKENNFINSRAFKEMVFLAMITMKEEEIERENREMQSFLERHMEDVRIETINEI